MKTYLPTMPEITKQTILFVVATIATAIIVSQFPQIKNLLKSEQ